MSFTYGGGYRTFAEYSNRLFKYVKDYDYN